MTNDDKNQGSCCTDAIVEALAAIQVPPSESEAYLHGAITAALLDAGIAFSHEHSLGRGCRIDFLCDGGVGIEVKKGKPNRKSLAKQVERYAAFKAVTALVVVVERNLFDPIREAGGKPVAYVSLSRNWGVAL